MDATDALRNGDLSQTMVKLKEQVLAEPAVAKHRIFLFQLLSVLGQWDRALTQLSVVGEMDAGALAMVQAYREALQCESLRKDVFQGKRSPLVFGEPSDWIALLIESLRLHATGSVAQGQEMRDAAFEKAPMVSGALTLAGENAVQHEFQWIADADSRLGPSLEVIVNGRYYFAPFNRIRRIDIEAPEDLRDFVWLPAHFLWSSGGETVGFIPTRYCGSEDSEDDAVRLARKTTWTDVGDGVFEGLGQRLLATDQGEYSVMDIRQISLNVEEQGSEENSDQGEAV